jgi:putative ABC transport system permease protein
MGNLLSDLRYGFRTLRKNPGFAAVAVLALALGIGANTAIFSAVYATLLEPLPYPHSEQLVMVWSLVDGNKNVTAAGDYLDWVRYNSTFQYLGAWTGSSVNLSTSGRPERIEASTSTPGFQASMGHKFLFGRDFLPEEGEPGKDHVAILSNRLWRSRFASDPNIVGKQFEMNGQMSTIVGVLAPGPADHLNNQMYIPLAFKPDQKNHDFHWLLVLGRLKPGVTIDQANADMQNVAKRIAEENPKSNTGWSAKVEPLQNDFLDRDVIRALWLLLGAAGFVLLIACANIANLLLARATTRQREVAVRASLGASRGRLFGQFLAESLALSMIGCLVGTALAWILVRIIMATMPPYTLPSEADVRLSLPVLGFTIAASLLSGVLFGCVPAWQAAHMNLNDVLKEGGRGGSGGRHGLRRTLVVFEFALALSLLTGGGLAIHSLWNVAHVDLGFKSDHLLTFFLPVPDGHLNDPAQIVNFYQQLRDRVTALPGVTAMSISEGMPMQGTNFGMPFTIEGHDVADPSKRPGAGFNMVTPGFFDTFGIHVIKGRPLTEQDRAGGMQVAVVNEAFVKKYFAGVDPLSQRLLVEQLVPGVAKLGPASPWQIVGVYRNVKNGGAKGDGFPEIDVPFAQSPWPQAAIAVRTVGDPGAVSKSIADIVQSFDSNLPLAEVKTMDQIVDEAKGGDRFVALLFGGFAGLALILAALGIYGVMSFAVAQRTHEIGLRMALGADSSNVLKLILREGMLLAALGAALGLVGAYFVGRGMQSIFFGVGKIDFTAFSIVAVLLMMSAVLACWVPAHRATRVDPMQALRDE